MARVAVLRGLDLAVRAGECIAVLGSPGCGKTTLLLCCAGLMRIDSGVVRWFGASTPTALAFLSLGAPGRPAPHIARPVRPRRALAEAAPHLLDRAPDADPPPATPSGCRAELARLAAREARLLLIDDVEADDVLEEIVAVVRSCGRAAVVTRASHAPRIHSVRTMVLRDGQLTALTARAPIGGGAARGGVEARAAR